ncbi:hypothetical protein CGK03_24205 [Vibrio parahaemolyticus]|nr:hypothetical protein CGK03_24205 [Vibrio parahaemolyticus]TOR08578.1 hypothetical protein CGG81_04005 [Vibrio parahaemolyticus]
MGRVFNWKIKPEVQHKWVCKIVITKRSRAIRNAWQFLFAVSKVFMAQCRSFCIALLTP